MISILRLRLHSKTSWNTCKTLWYIVKHCEPLVKQHEPLVKHETLLKQCKTSWNTQTLVIQCEWMTSHSMRQYWRSMRRRRRLRRVTGNIGTEFLAISAITVLVSPQMCNRVTNHADMGTFSRHAPWWNSCYGLGTGPIMFGSWYFYSSTLIQQQPKSTLWKLQCTNYNTA